MCFAGGNRYWQKSANCAQWFFIGSELCVNIPDTVIRAILRQWMDGKELRLRPIATIKACSAQNPVTMKMAS